MKQIDWSSAPEGATHWEPVSDGHGEGWMKKHGREWFFLGAESRVWREDAVSAKRAGTFVPRPVAWAGEGLPPVGTVCEVMDDAGCWRRAEVRVHGIDRGREIAICQADDIMLWCRDGVHCRPARAPEQLAAAERDRIIHQMLDGLSPVGHTPGYTYQLVNCLYDAGYRKAGGAA